MLGLLIDITSPDKSTAAMDEPDYRDAFSERRKVVLTLSAVRVLMRDTVSSWLDDYAPSMSAALSYYTLFSLAPLLLIVIAVAGLVFGEDAARGQIFAELSTLIGAQSAAAIQGLLANVNRPVRGFAATVLGLALVGVGATAVFAELQNALDRIWRAPARQRHSGWLALIRARLMSFGMILAIGFLLIVSLILSAAVAALGRWWGPAFVGWEIMAQTLNVVLSFALTTVIIAAIYKFMPRVRVRWQDVWIGAIATALLLSLGKALIGIYIGKSGIASGFGAAASVVVVLVWVYYSALLFLLGAEFTWVYAGMFGSQRQRARLSDRVTRSQSGTKALHGGASKG